MALLIPKPTEASLGLQPWLNPQGGRRLLQMLGEPVVDQPQAYNRNLPEGMKNV